MICTGKLYCIDPVDPTEWWLLSTSFEFELGKGQVEQVEFTNDLGRDVIPVLFQVDGPSWIKPNEVTSYREARMKRVQVLQDGQQMFVRTDDTAMRLY